MRSAAQEIDGTPVAVMVLPACRNLLPLIRHFSWKDKKGYYDHLYDLHSLVIRAWGVLGCMECRLHAVVLFYPPYGLSEVPHPVLRVRQWWHNEWRRIISLCWENISNNRGPDFSGMKSAQRVKTFERFRHWRVRSLSDSCQAATQAAGQCLQRETLFLSPLSAVEAAHDCQEYMADRR